MHRALELPVVVALALLYSIAGAAHPKPGHKPAEPKPGSTAAAPEKKDKQDPFKGLEFRNIGPAMTSGRVIDVAIHPNNHDIRYVAVGSGGLWKTLNAGTTWQPVIELDPFSWTSSHRGIRCPAGPRTVVAAHGECSVKSFRPELSGSSSRKASRRAALPAISDACSAGELVEWAACRVASRSSLAQPPDRRSTGRHGHADSARDADLRAMDGGMD